MLTETPQTDKSTGNFADLDPIVRLKEFLRITGLGRSTVYKLISDGVIDRPVHLSERAVGLRMSSVTKFLNSRRTTAGAKS